MAISATIDMEQLFSKGKTPSETKEKCVKILKSPTKGQKVHSDCFVDCQTIWSFT